MSEAGSASSAAGAPARPAKAGASPAFPACLAALAFLAVPAPAGAAGDVAFGEYLSSLCVTCHQVSGRATGGIPPIVGWPQDQFVAVVNAYRWKERENLVMQTVTAQLSDEEIAALAAYFESLSPRLATE